MTGWEYVLVSVQGDEGAEAIAVYPEAPRIRPLRPGARGAVAGVSIGSSVLWVESAIGGAGGARDWSAKSLASRPHGLETARLPWIGGDEPATPVEAGEAGGMAFFSYGTREDAAVVWGVVDGLPRSVLRAGPLRRAHSWVAIADHVVFFGDTFLGSTAVFRWEPRSPSPAQAALILPVRELAVLGASAEQVLYSALSVDTGREPGVTDGTVAGTTQFDVRPGSESSAPMALGIAGGRILFSADDGVHGREPWSASGTTTALIADMLAGGEGSDPRPVAAYGERFIFSAEGADGLRRVFSTDGQTVTPVGSQAWLDVSSGAVIDGRLVFSAQNQPGNWSLMSVCLTDDTVNADRDGDGFSDVVEAALGADPYRAANTPFGSFVRPSSTIGSGLSVEGSFPPNNARGVLVLEWRTSLADLKRGDADRRVIVRLGPMVRAFVAGGARRSSVRPDDSRLRIRRSVAGELVVRVVIRGGRALEELGCVRGTNCEVAHTAEVHVDGHRGEAGVELTTERRGRREVLRTSSVSE